MQNNSLWYGIVAVALVAVAVVGWMLMGGDLSSLGDSTPQTQNTTLTNLMTMSGSHKCTFDTSTQDSQSSGTVYVSGGQMRGDFTSTTAGETVESHMIIMDNTNYMWSDAMPQGIKMSLESMTTASDSAPQGAVDPNAAVDYSCSMWVADASVFTLPTNITFQDMSAMMQGGIPGAGAGASGSAQVGASSAQCAACETISDPDTKAQCKAALSCK